MQLAVSRKADAAIGSLCVLGSGMSGYLDQSMAKIKEFEGSVPWMYLDTVGKVTVGVGLMLVNELAATALPFTIAGRSATSEEIGREFARVSAMKKGQLAHAYFSKQGLALPEQIIESKLKDTLIGFEGYLRTHLPGYDALPGAAKLSLLDMVYNLGPGRLFSEYPRLLAAVERGDWKTAAAACLRRGPSVKRNLWTEEQFRAAAAVVVLKAEAESLGNAGVVLGLISGVAAAAAIAIMFGELDRIAARTRPHRNR